MCGDWSAADDLVQEALFILYRRWEHVDPSARRAYACAVMSRLATRRTRDLLRERCTTQPPDLVPAQPHDDLVANRLAIKAALRGLTERQRTIVYLRYWGALPTKAIARVMHIPAGTVRSDLTRAIKRLRELLRQEFPQPRALGSSCESAGHARRVTSTVTSMPVRRGPS
jgi:RNA polymerase sigma factor (sigma-70 family)